MLQSHVSKPIKKILITLVILLSATWFVEVLAAPSQQETEKKLAKIQQQIRNSQQNVEKQRGEIGSLEKQLREAEQSIGKLNQQLDITETQLKKNQDKIAELQTEEKQLQQQLSKHHEILYAQIRSEYQYGGQQKLKLLLNQQEPEKLGRNLIYYDYLNRARLSEINKATELLQSVHQVQIQIRQEEDLAKLAKEKLLNEKQLLQQAQSKRKTAINSLNNNISSEKQKLASLADNEKQLKDLIEKLRAALKDIPGIDQGKGFNQLKGQLYWPVVGMPSNKFGQSRNAARNKLSWEGVFIPSTEGNNVRSIYHGRIAFAEWMRGLGLLIIVDHGDGYMSLYGHNQSLFKQVGEWVNAGEKLASVGNSGGSNRPGLYFEIRKQGNPVNPAQWCAKSAASRRPSTG